MSASLQYALRNLARRRSRTVIGIAGIFLTIALLTALQIGLDTLSVSYLDLVALQAGKADVVINRTGGDFFNPPAFDAEAVLSQLPGKKPERAAGPAVAEGPAAEFSPRWFGVVQVQCRGEEHYAVLIGLDPERERRLNLSGLVPDVDIKPGTCAISQPLAQKLNAKSGGRLSVRSSNSYNEADLSVGGVVTRQLILPQQVRDYIIVEPAAARQITGSDRQVHALAGAFRQPQAYYDARDLHGSVLRLKQAGASIASRLGIDYDVKLPKAAAIIGFQEFTSPLRAIFGVFALLALTITGLLIYSLISVAVEERVREYAILRTLGAKQRNVFGFVLIESMLLCFAGVLPGVVAGALGSALLIKLVGLALSANGAALTLRISLATLLFTFAGGIALSVGSALVPAWQATRWRIVDALDPLRRGQVEISPPSDGRVNRPLVLAGVVLSALSVVVFFVLPTAVLSGNPSLLGTVVLCLLVSILLGFTLASVGVLPFLQRVLLWLLRPVLGATGELSGRNLERHRRRHTTTALLFTLSVSLVIFVASLVALAARTALALVEYSHGADLRVEAPRGAIDSAKPDLQRLKGVSAVAQARFLHSRSESGIAYDVVASDLVGMKHVWVVPFGVDEDLARVIYTRGIVSESGNPQAISDLGKGNVSTHRGDASTNEPPPVILSLSIARFLDVAAGDLIQLSFRLGSERADGRFRVAAVCSSLPGFRNFRGRVALAVGSGVLMSMKHFESMTHAAPAEAFQGIYFVKADGDANAQKSLARQIREDFDVRYRFGVSSTAEQKQEARVLYWATQVLFGGLLVVAVVIAVFALIASMASTVIERRHEIGILKGLGLRRSGLFRLFLGESVILTLSSGLAGGAIGFTLAWLFVLEASLLMELGVAFTMPYLTFAATILISLVAGALAAHLPTRKLLHKSTAEILRLES